MNFNFNQTFIPTRKFKRLISSKSENFKAKFSTSKKKIKCGVKNTIGYGTSRWKKWLSMKEIVNFKNKELYWIHSNVKKKNFWNNQTIIVTFGFLRVTQLITLKLRRRKMIFQVYQVLQDNQQSNDLIFFSIFCFYFNIINFLSWIFFETSPYLSFSSTVNAFHISIMILLCFAWIFLSLVYFSIFVFCSL